MLPKIPTVGIRNIRSRDLSKWVARGWKFEKDLGDSGFAIRKRYSPWEQFEMRTRALFQLASFEHAIANIEDFHYTELGVQIDVCGGIENYFVVLDCTQSTRKHPISLKQKLHENHAKKARILKALGEKWAGKYDQLMVGVCVEGVEVTQRDLTWSSELNIPIIDSSFMDRCVKYVETLGQTIRYQILGRLGIRGIPTKGMQSDHFKFPAMAIHSGEKLLYSFCADPESLLKLAYVYRLERFGKGIKDRNLITMPSKGGKFKWNLFDGEPGVHEYPEYPSGGMIKNMNSFLSVLRATCKADWRKQEKGFILTNNGLNVMLRILADILKAFDAEGRQYRKSSLRSFVGNEIGRYIEEKSSRKLRGQTLGEDGRAKTAKEIWARLAKKNHLASGA